MFPNRPSSIASPKCGCGGRPVLRAVSWIGPYLNSWVMGHLVCWINSKCICVSAHMCVCSGSFGKPGSHLAYSRLPATPEITERLLQSITCRQGLVWKLEGAKERGKLTNEKREMAVRDIQWWNKILFLVFSQETESLKDNWNTGIKITLLYWR